MWRARASTGLPPCHDLVAGGGEFLCPEELWESNDAHKISRNDCGCHERRNRNGLPRAVALEQQRADASPSAARVHRLRRSGLAEEFPRMDVTVKDTKRFAASGGWGYFNFNHHEPKAPTAKVTECGHACHLAVPRKTRSGPSSIPSWTSNLATHVVPRDEGRS